MLNVRVRDTRPFTKTVALEGRLDAETASQFDEALDAVLASDIKVLVFDLETLDYISSAGLRGLFRAQKTMRERDGKAVLVHVQPQVKKVLDIVKAVDVDSVFKSIDELDTYLDAMQKKVVKESTEASES